jgi:hypothetical protein
VCRVLFCLVFWWLIVYVFSFIWNVKLGEMFCSWGVSFSSPVIPPSSLLLRVALTVVTCVWFLVCSRHAYYCAWRSQCFLFFCLYDHIVTALARGAHSVFCFSPVWSHRNCSCAWRSQCAILLSVSCKLTPYLLLRRALTVCDLAFRFL